jgi:hypothetical protein
MEKIKVILEHADGKRETLNVSHSLAICLTQRFVEQGWPWITPIINGKRILSQDGNCANAFLTFEKERIVI